MKLLSLECGDVKEFLDELVEDWPQYLLRLASYMDLMSGSLVEDPRNIQSDTLNSLFGLRLPSINNDNDDDDDEDNKP